MTLRQIANLRTDGPTWIPDRDCQQAWELKAEAARAGMRARGDRYAVAPGQRIVTAAGLVLEEGKPVSLKHFEGLHGRE